MMAKPLSAQHLLDKKLSVNIQYRPLQQALATISHKGNFHFSYNSNLISDDSLVSVSVEQKPVKEILQLLLGNNYEYRESGNYIIIRKNLNSEKTFVISGYVTNKKTGEKVPYASVYDKQQLISTLTNEKGYFRLRLHSHSRFISLSVNKLFYQDTSFELTAKPDKSITLFISPIRSITLDSVTVKPYSGLGSSWLGKLFISSRQRIQDINLSDFFVWQPFQYSLVPGIGTHGKMSSQVVNKFSVNIIGGYTAGVNGVELGGLFNIDKKDVRYVQLAGIFNITGSGMKGIQAAGLYNRVLDSAKGVQAAGLVNVTGKHVNGVQAAGLFNAGESVSGIQLAGLGNISKSLVTGVQVASLFNYAQHLNGLQIGMVNIADTSSGYSIGLVNIIKHNGYYKLSLSWNEALSLSAAFKTGNKKLYNILLVGAHLENKQNIFAIGYGIGKEFTFSNALSMTTELTDQNIIIGYKNDVPILVRLQPALQLRLSKKLSLFAGPAFSLYFAGSSRPVSSTRDMLIPKQHLTLWKSTTAWFGGQIGITFL